MTTTINFEKKIWEQILMSEEQQSKRREIQGVGTTLVRARRERQSILRGY